MTPSVLALLLLISIKSYGQLPNMSFEYITDRVGLPSRSVTCAVEDSSGFMWFGTRKCLTRYDGYTFRPVGTIGIYGMATDRSETCGLQTGRV